MRLTDPWFEAEFIGDITETSTFRRLGGHIQGAQGVFFYGPCGYGREDGTHAIVVAFANPRNAAAVPPGFKPLPRWTITGSSLDDLTLTTSIDCTVEKPEDVAAHRAAGLNAGECAPGRMCWHGFITNGEVR